MTHHGRSGTSADDVPRLVSSNRVEGMPVLGRDGDKLGTVAAFLIDRFSGRCEYVVVTMGGVLGMGGSYHPLPWELLGFDPARGGYVITVDKAVLSGGPSFKAGSEPVFDHVYIDRVAGYFGVSRDPAA